MKNAKIRNLGIIAHIDAGKTTTSERILFYSGRIHRMGEVHHGDTVMDYREDEQERGITIGAAAATIPWRDHTINLIDTPGHVDFTAEVERSLRVIDGAIVVICGVAGVEAQSETVWRQADHYRVPRMVFVNKLDRTGADYHKAIQSLVRRLGARPIVLQEPIRGENDELLGLIDLVTMEALDFSGSDVVERRPIDAAQAAEAAKGREKLIETLADVDDAVAEKYLGGEAIEVPELKAALRRAALALQLVPVFAGASLRNVGIQPLLDGVIDYLPAPCDVPAARGHDPKDEGRELTRDADDKAPFSALVFKVQAQVAGEIFFLRIYSGKLEVGDAPLNARTGKREKIHDLLRMHAKSGERVKSATAGDIVAIPGLKHSVTGDTLYDEKHPIAYESIHFPEPVVSIAIEPKSNADKDKLDDCLKRMVREDPTFSMREDPETGQLLLSGMGELHLEVITNRLAREFKVQANVGKPRVSYRERIAAPQEIEREVTKTIGGKTLFGLVKLKVEPGDDMKATADAAGTALLPKPLKDQIVEHLQGELLGTGSWGYTLMGTRAQILAAATKEIDPAGLGLPYAISEAFAAALEAAGTELLEPIMRIEVTTPAEHLGAVHRALQAKRVEIDDTRDEDGVTFIRGRVPMSQMFGFSGDLRTISQGRAAFSMEPAGYQPVPPDVARRMFGEPS